jgi:hypothetical protein
VPSFIVIVYNLASVKGINRFVVEFNFFRLMDRFFFFCMFLEDLFLWLLRNQKKMKLESEIVCIMF